MQITNISQGPRGVNTPNGPVLIRAGESIDADLSKDELAVAKSTGWFEFGKADAKTDDKK